MTDPDLEVARQRVLHLLEAGKEWEEVLDFDLKLRLALHLSPIEAINYDPHETKSRRELIRQFLIQEHNCPLEESVELARDVARVLIAWDESRQSVTGYMPEILARQESKCACCKVHLLSSSDETISQVPPETLKRNNEFKPYHRSPAELLSPEVDHIEPISRLGRNHANNLQVLCRLCNRGKGDRLGLDTRTEAKYAASQLSSIPTHFIAQMIYYIIMKSNSECTLCESKTAELTMRKRAQRGPFLRSNLYAICIKCASFENES